MGHTIDKLSNSNFSRPALVAGIVLMLFFGALPMNQSAQGLTEEIEVFEHEGEYYETDQIFLLPAGEEACPPAHWHALFGDSIFSLNGVELPEFFEFCGYGEFLEFFIISICDNPGEVCRTGEGICEGDAVCTPDGMCPDNEFIVDILLPCNLGDDPECTELSFCDGSGPNCPTAEHFAANTMCGDQETNTACNGADTCDGSGNCLDNIAQAQTACETDNNECTKNECDGSGACIHPNEPTTKTCGDQTDTDCNEPNTCDGAGGCDENFVAADTACGDGPMACSNQDTCDGSGVCDKNHVNQGALCPDDANSCTDDECDGNGMCTHPNKANGAACTDDGNSCTKDECNAGACVHPNQPNGFICVLGNACQADSTCDAAGTCNPGANVVCNDFDICTNDSCIVPFGCQFVPNGVCGGPCVDPTGGPVNCDDGNICTADSCDNTLGCVNTPTTSLCNDSDGCTTNDMCDSSGQCVGNTDNPSCLMIEPNPDNETFDLEYECVDDNEVSITSATFTRDGEPLEPTDLSFYCPPGIVIGGLEFGDIPNDFTADVTINGVEGNCVIEEGEDISAISFELIDGVVECFRGEGSDSILFLTDPDDGGVIGAAVGGSFIPIDSTALVVAYAQNNLAWIIPLLMITAAIGFMKFGRSKSSENSI